MLRQYTYIKNSFLKKRYNYKLTRIKHQYLSTITSIKTQAHNIEVKWSDRSKPSIINHKWLRSCCECSSCLSEHSNQKIFLTSDIPLDIFPDNIEINDENGNKKIIVRWNDGHHSQYSESFLKQYDLETLRQQYSEMYPELWDNETLTKSGGIPFFEFNDYMNDEEKLFNVMTELNEKGLVILKNAPVKDLCVLECAKKLGNIRETMYGVHFDVISKPSANNIAYSSRELPLHQDLCYYESPPGFQYLHCMRFDQKEGGDSLFADGFFIANKLKNEDPEAFNALSTYKTTFHKYGEDHHMIYSRSIIEKDDEDKVIGLYWSPPFEGPMRGLNNNDLEIYYRAYKKFKELTLKPENVIQYRMKVGDIVIFNNRRILHARTSYDENAGIRHLQGTYTETETFLSKYRVLIRKYRNGSVPKLSGNHSF